MPPYIYHDSEHNFSFSIQTISRPMYSLFVMASKSRWEPWIDMNEKRRALQYFHQETKLSFRKYLGNRRASVLGIYFDSAVTAQGTTDGQTRDPSRFA